MDVLWRKTIEYFFPNVYNFNSCVRQMRYIDLYKLCMTSEPNQLWIALLCSCMGYVLPNPKFKHQLES